MSVQIIKKGDRAEYAVLPYADYLKLRALAEDVADIRAFDEATAHNEETLPHDIVKRLLVENRILVWREYRGITQQALAKAVDISKSYLSQIEAGKKTGSVRVLRALARVLNVDLDDLSA